MTMQREDHLMYLQDMELEEHQNHCKYLGNDMWSCGHMDNRASDETCGCHICMPPELGEMVPPPK